jgi:hypothetical protein
MGRRGKSFLLFFFVVYEFLGEHNIEKYNFV